MRLFSKLRDPQLALTTRMEDSIEILERGSFVSLISDRWLRRTDPTGALALKQWGYRFIEREVRSFSSLYVRPLPLWLLHKAGHNICWWLLSMLDWLFRKGLVSLACFENVEARWRDIRPLKMGRTRF